MVIPPQKLKGLFNEYGIWPSKSKGQNFLINQNVLDKIVEAADLKSTDYVLEIGPGFGILTEELIKKVKKVLSIELDKRLVYFLKQKFKHETKLEVLLSDVLKIKNIELYKKLVGEKEDYKLVANLPYNITGAVLRKFLTYEPKPAVIILLLQKEVAQRIIAKPPKMSLLSLSVQYYGKPQIIDYVSKESFYPKPEVDSAIIKIELKKDPILNQINEKKFWQLAKIGFSSPRKQLQNNLVAGLKINKETIKIALKSVKLAPECRPADLDLEQWISLSKNLVM
ncbi:ribosomal RNA small subunit methyltransferase A [Candidatus Falkowbacteria bacterium]|nr:ribosomal RNA small subunit methyltransferase A [Candidatus Falkowbacteria bacterium]